jgi:hypothetical protein
MIRRIDDILTEKWDHEDNEILWPWLLRGIYEMKGGAIGRTVLMTKVVEYIKAKNYWGNERELEKYLHINAGDSYRRNVYKITRSMIDRDLLKSHDEDFRKISITRLGINLAGKHFPELQ